MIIEDECLSAYYGHQHKYYIPSGKFDPPLHRLPRAEGVALASHARASQMYMYACLEGWRGDSEPKMCLLVTAFATRNILLHYVMWGSGGEHTCKGKHIVYESITKRLITSSKKLNITNHTCLSVVPTIELNNKNAKTY